MQPKGCLRPLEEERSKTKPSKKRLQELIEVTDARPLESPSPRGQAAGRCSSEGCMKLSIEGKSKTTTTPAHACEGAAGRLPETTDGREGEDSTIVETASKLPKEAERK